MNKAPNKKNSAWHNPWFLSWMGLLVFVLIINTSAVWMAVTKKPRLLTKDFYEKGKAYSDNRLKREAERLKWDAKIERPDNIPFSQSSTFRYQLFDDKHQLASAEEVIFYAYRPSDGSFDFAKPMQEQSIGKYEVTLKFPLKGIWDIIISAKQNNKEHNTALNIIVRDADN